MPTLEEARADLNDIRTENHCMNQIAAYAFQLSHRQDCDPNYYHGVCTKVMADIERGKNVERQILVRYPQLKSRYESPVQDVQKTGSDIDSYLDRDPLAEFRDNE